VCVYGYPVILFTETYPHKSFPRPQILWWVTHCVCVCVLRVWACLCRTVLIIGSNVSVRGQAHKRKTINNKYYSYPIQIGTSAVNEYIFRASTSCLPCEADFRSLQTLLDHTLHLPQLPHNSATSVRQNQASQACDNVYQPDYLCRVRTS
jgi:hypothetical protein